MKKKDIKDQAWYLSKRLWEGQGIIGRITKGIEEGKLLDQFGQTESRKIRPLANFRKFIYGQEKTEEDKKEADNMVKVNFEELTKNIKKYAKQQAKKTGKSLDEVINSKPFKKYLLSRLK